MTAPSSTTSEPHKKMGIFDLLGLAISILKENPSLSLPSFISSGIQSIQSLIIMFVFLYVIETSIDVSIFEDILSGKIIESLLVPEILDFLVITLKAFLFGIVIVDILRNIFYSAFLYPYAYKLLKGEEISFFKCWSESISLIKKIIPAAVIVESISVGIPLLAISLIIDKILELAKVSITLNTPLGNGKISILMLAISVVLIIMIVFAIVMHLLFIFVYQIIVVENLNVVSALAKSLFLAIRNIVNLIVYSFLEIALFIIIFLISAIFQLLYIEVSEVLQLILLAILSPILSIVLFGMYLQSIGIHINYKPKREYSIMDLLLKKLNQGFSYLKNYFKRFNNFKFIIPAIVVYFLGFILGLEYSRGPLGELLGLLLEKGRIGSQLGEFSSIYMFTGIFAHNWLVSILTVFSGILGFPLPLINCLFNGVFVGVVYGLISPSNFIVAVLPHGFIEIPCFIIASSAGVKLGVSFLTNKEKTNAVAREAVYILIGLAPLFLISALIEALITPLLLKVLGYM